MQKIQDILEQAKTLLLDKPDNSLDELEFTDEFLAFEHIFLKGKRKKLVTDELTKIDKITTGIKHDITRIHRLKPKAEWKIYKLLLDFKYNYAEHLLTRQQRLLDILEQLHQEDINK